MDQLLAGIWRVWYDEHDDKIGCDGDDTPDQSDGTVRILSIITSTHNVSVCPKHCGTIMCHNISEGSIIRGCQDNN